MFTQTIKRFDTLIHSLRSAFGDQRYAIAESRDLFGGAEQTHNLGWLSVLHDAVEVAQDRRAATSRFAFTKKTDDEFLLDFLVDMVARQKSMAADHDEKYKGDSELFFAGRADGLQTWIDEILDDAKPENEFREKVIVTVPAAVKVPSL